MKTMISTFKKKDKRFPLVLTQNNKQIFIHVDWTRSSSNSVHLIIKADLDVDVLIPSTFNKLKDKIIELESEIERLKHVQD